MEIFELQQAILIAHGAEGEVVNDGVAVFLPDATWVAGCPAKVRLRRSSAWRRSAICWAIFPVGNQRAAGLPSLLATSSSSCSVTAVRSSCASPSGHQSVSSASNSLRRAAKL